LVNFKFQISNGTQSSYFYWLEGFVWDEIQIFVSNPKSEIFPVLGKTYFAFSATPESA